MHIGHLKSVNHTSIFIASFYNVTFKSLLLNEKGKQQSRNISAEYQLTLDVAGNRRREAKL